jgi:uncharacterized membrane protein
MVGAIVVASALIFGALAGGVIVHRLDTTSSASSEQEQSSEKSDKAEKSEKAQEKGDKSEKGNGQPKKKHANTSQNNSSAQGEQEDK